MTVLDYDYDSPLVHTYEFQAISQDSGLRSAGAAGQWKSARINNNSPYINLCLLLYLYHTYDT